MSYLVLARKYRPQSFDDLVGQEHVAKTLGNAIDQGRVAHAFLFTGVRGVGKTTSARLLAKCLNCLGADGKATGPTKTPCQVCSACTEITAGVDMDVQEIDGASYTGIDDVRRLQESLVFRPARDRFKVYIVDEVHMLSINAWNAFLKTLEEPPPHVKFIFATTEVHKVPVTILSRCQRYDFKLIGADVIRARLRQVLDLEKIQAEDAAIAILAREAAGSMRDAMSLLDQVIAYSAEKMTAEDVARVLGVADREVMRDLSRAVLAGEGAGVLGVITKVAEQGFDLMHVARDFLRHLRNLVVAKVGTAEERKLTITDLADAELADVVELAEKTELDDLLRVYQGFSKAYDEIAKSPMPRAQLEVTLVRLARRPALLPLDELLSRLGDLEKRLSGGGPPAPRGGPSAGGGPGGGGGGRPGARADDRGAPSFDRPPATSSSTPTGAGSPRAPRASHGPPPIAKTSLAIAARPREEEQPEFVVPEIAITDRTPELPPVKAIAAAPAAPPKPPPPSAPAATMTAWREIVTRVRAEDPSFAALFDQASPVEVSKERVVIGYRTDSFEGQRVTESRAVDVLTANARAYFDAPTQIAVDVSSSMPHATLAQVDAEARRIALAEAKAKVVAHPMVASVIRLFEAELRDVRVPEE